MGFRRRRHRADVPSAERRSYAYAACTKEEYAIVKRFAEQDRLSVSDFVRRCINSYLLEVSGDDVPMLKEMRSGE